MTPILLTVLPVAWFFVRIELDEGRGIPPLVVPAEESGEPLGFSFSFSRGELSNPSCLPICKAVNVSIASIFFSNCSASAALEENERFEREIEAQIEARLLFSHINLLSSWPYCKLARLIDGKR